MGRQFLFVLFQVDECVVRHMFWYAESLGARGHTVRIIVEGPATALAADPKFQPLLVAAQQRGQMAGLCAAASAAGGCNSALAGGAGPNPIQQFCGASGIALLDDMRGHAEIGAFIDAGYELVTF